MIACEPCALDWPELHAGFGGLVMKERCRMPFAATGFRLRTRGELNAQLGPSNTEGTAGSRSEWGSWLGRGSPTGSPWPAVGVGSRALALAEAMEARVQPSRVDCPGLVAGVALRGRFIRTQAPSPPQQHDRYEPG